MAETGPAGHRSVTATCNTEETRVYPRPPTRGPSSLPQAALYAVTDRAVPTGARTRSPRPAPTPPAKAASRPAANLPARPGGARPRRPPQTKATTARTDDPRQAGWLRSELGQLPSEPPTALSRTRARQGQAEAQAPGSRSTHSQTRGPALAGKDTSQGLFLPAPVDALDTHRARNPAPFQHAQGYPGPESGSEDAQTRHWPGLGLAVKGCLRSGQRPQQPPPPTFGAACPGCPGPPAPEQEGEPVWW